MRGEYYEARDWSEDLKPRGPTSYVFERYKCGATSVSPPHWGHSTRAGTTAAPSSLWGGVCGPWRPGYLFTPQVRFL